MNRRRGIATAGCFLMCAHLGLGAERKFEWKTESEVVASTANGIERALAYPEAKRKLATL